MKCPYEDDLGCPYVDTAVMDKEIECSECEHYHNGVRPTGATPVLGWMIDKWNEFMMGL